MRIFLMLLCFLNLSFALELEKSFEQYQNQLQILSHLDIEDGFITDEHFLATKDEIKAMHSGTLIHSAADFYEFLPQIRKILHEQGLPEEFLYLAIVESGLKMHAASNAKAVGIWQFMPSTARELGLRIDAFVDERRDPFKSSVAAAQYLKGLKDEFGKWYLAILAYNCGNGKLAKAIKQAKSDDLSVLLDPDKKYLPLETRNFIRKILILAFEANNKDFLFSKEASFANYALSTEFSKVEVPSSVSLREFANKAKISYESLKRYNPHFRYDFTPPGNGYYLYIPEAMSASFSQTYEPKKLAKVDTKIPNTQEYRVKAGDTLYSIAKKFKIKIADIRALNKISKSHLSINQKLILPLKESIYAENSKFIRR